MQSRLLITSNSCFNMVKNKIGYDDCIIITESPKKALNKKWNGDIIAFGGGSVIDSAKMIGKENPVYAIPTTASGSACTDWAVIWEPEKQSIKCSMPILCETYRLFPIKLPKKVAESTYYDCKAHIQDSRVSKNSTHLSQNYCSVASELLKRYELHKGIDDLIGAGNYAGKAIQITGTGLFHALSYIITMDYGVEHGQALKEAMIFDKKYDWNKIIHKAKLYEKFNNHL